MVCRYGAVTPVCLLAWGPWNVQIFMPQEVLTQQCYDIAVNVDCGVARVGDRTVSPLYMTFPPKGTTGVPHSAS